MEELKALETAKNELIKVRDKYLKKAEKERIKANDVYVIIQGEKCYTESDINAWIEADYISASQADKYIEKLEKKLALAGQINGLTKSERVCKILDNIIMNICTEIKDIKYKEELEKKREERWKIAQSQGCSYTEFLDLEEVNRRSEEYELLMGLK